MNRSIDAAAGPRPEDRDAFIRRSLITRLLNDQSVAELANLPLGALAIALTWGSVPLRAQLVWFAALATATFVRMFIRRRVAVSDLERGIPKRLRAAIVFVAAVWGIGVFTLAPYTPPVEVALVLLIVCGLTAAATSTLLADAIAYSAYNAVMLGFTALAALRLSSDGAFRVAFVVVLLYGGVMASLYSRLRRVLMQSLDNEYGMRIASASAERERAFLDKLIDSAPNAILVVHPDSRVKRANSSFERLFGFTVEEVGDRPLGDLIVPPSDRTAADAVGRTLVDGRTVEMEAQRLRKDGVVIDVRISATRMDGENGGTLVMYDDITERKSAERALRDSEARLFRTLASLPVGILVVDAEGVPHFANDAARRLLGPGVAATDPEARARDLRIIRRRHAHAVSHGSPARVPSAQRRGLEHR